MKIHESRRSTKGTKIHEDLLAFRQSAQPTTLDEITVQRINVVEKDGTTRLVISNRDRAPEPVVNGSVSLTGVTMQPP